MFDKNFAASVLFGWMIVGLVCSLKALPTNGWELSILIATTCVSSAFMGVFLQIINPNKKGGSLEPALSKIDKEVS